MKKLYWRPSKVSWQIHVVIAILALASLALVETQKVSIRQPAFRTKVRAARIMKQGMEVLKEYRMQRLVPVDKLVDPLETGMIGLINSPITSNTGSLEAKQTSANPNWAAVMVEMLRKARVKEGDTVAMGLSGSFPALNLAAYSAAQAMKLRVIAISSIAASNWGANIPRFSWVDMERILNKHNVVTYRSIAASLGGQWDQGNGMPKEGKASLRKSIERNKLHFIDVKDTDENLEIRMDMYDEYAGDESIAAYINVGGGTISVGTAIGKKLFTPGLNRRPSAKALTIDSILSRFAKQGVPVIHMRNITKLAAKYGLPVTPKRMPKVGQGSIYQRLEYNTYLVVACLVLLLAALYLFIKRDIGYRIFTFRAKASSDTPPQQMV